VSRCISDCICPSLNFWSVDDAPTDSTASSNSESDESSDLKEPGYIDTEIKRASPEGGASAPAKSTRKKKDKNCKKRGETHALITSKRNLGASMLKMDSDDILLDASDTNHAIGKRKRPASSK
jgi:hypothetical protein